MNKRHNPRKASNALVNLHFHGEQIDISHCHDYSEGGFFIKTPLNRTLDKGIVALITIEESNQVKRRYLAEVVRLTEDGVGFQIIEEM